MPSLDQARANLSPRVSRPPIPVLSWLIQASVLALFVILSSRALIDGGVLAWSSGLVYIAYDTALLCFVFWQTWPLRTHLQLSPSPRDILSVGVIIAAYNEGPALSATVASILAQADPPEEIVIADDGSDDATATILLQHFGLTPPPLGSLSAPSISHPSLRWLRLPHGGKAEALNAALPVIRSDIVVTIDADTFLEEGALRAMRGAFCADTHLVAATGILIPVCGPHLTGSILQWFQHYEYIRNAISRFAWMRVDSLLLVSGAFAGYRRDALITVGGFDPECLVEDYEVIHRLYRYSADQALNWRVRVLGSAVARTEAPGTIPAFLRQRRRWFAGFLQTQFWNRDMLGNRQYGNVGTLMLPVKALDTLQPIYGITALLLLPIFLYNGQIDVAATVFNIISAKIILDVCFYVWAIQLYHRWIASTARINYGAAIFAAIVEPFTFQLLRHTGAALGWVTFLRGRQRWSGETIRRTVDLIQPEKVDPTRVS